MKQWGWMGIRFSAAIIVLLFAVGWDANATLHALGGPGGCSPAIGACITKSSAYPNVKCTTSGGGSEEFAGGEEPQCVSCEQRPNHICAWCGNDIQHYYPGESFGFPSCPDPD
jgi:hypothetical protein